MSKVPGGLTVDSDDTFSVVPEGAEEKLGDRLRAMAKQAVIRKRTEEFERRKTLLTTVYENTKAQMIRAAQVDGEFKFTVGFGPSNIGMDWFSSRHPTPLQVWFATMLHNDGIQLKWEGYKNQRDGDLIINSFVLSWA